MRAALLPPLLTIFLMMPGLAAARNGPTQPPSDPKDWPGKGAAGVFDLWTQRRQEFWENREKDKGAVVFFGDSITHRWAALDKAFPELKAANRGIGGDSSRRCVFRFREDVLDLQPRAVVILIGTNDMGHSTTPMDAAGNIRMMLAQATRHSPRMPVIVCHVMPRQPSPGKYPEKIAALNRLIDSLAIGRPNVYVCPTWPGMATPGGDPIPGVLADSVHPNEEGYRIWAANLRPVLARAGLLQARMAVGETPRAATLKGRRPCCFTHYAGAVTGGRRYRAR